MSLFYTIWKSVEVFVLENRDTRLIRVRNVRGNMLVIEMAMRRWVALRGSTRCNDQTFITVSCSYTKHKIVRAVNKGDDGS